MFVVVLSINKVSAQEMLYLKLDVNTQSQIKGVWEFDANTQKYGNYFYYDYQIYNGRPLMMYCDDQSLYYQDNIPIGQLPANIKTIEELDILLRGKSDAIQSAYWENKTIKIIQIHPNGQTFAIISVVLEKNAGSGKVSSTRE